MPDDKIRLQKYLANAGVSSRRQAEEHILEGSVTVNGAKIKKLGTKVSPGDIVMFRSKEVVLQTKKITYMLHKPAGFVSTTKVGKERGRTVLDLIPSEKRLYPVGRLDKDSTGLLLVSNDGDLALRLTHPRYQKEKEYLVTVNKQVTSDFVKQMASGVVLEGKKTQKAEVQKVSDQRFSIILREGRNRQVRRMAEELGYNVERLHRVRINNLKLGRLRSGQYTILTERQLKQLS